MSDAGLRPITIEAPAKLNLGLEVLGRRPDGYHDIATIYLSVGLQDRLTVMPSADLRVLCDQPELAGDANLVARALTALRNSCRIDAGARIELRKMIPVAAGLGGASSDAAAALLAARKLWRLPLTRNALADLALRVGSDVPFFLNGGCALGRGKGERLAPLPLPSDAWFVVVVPHVFIPRKTASLYAMLRTGDFSEGKRIDAQAARLRGSDRLDPDLLGNAFARVLHARLPWLAALPASMRACGASVVALSGAGPAHYALVDAPDRAERIADKLRTRLGNSASIFVVTAVPPRERDDERTI